jgi:hypothetical protein
MATTTTNFGWDIPQSTDLVKDGATAIAALGQDIDTALIDLKGGTTGQVLSKASGADLDYTWVAQDDSNAIQNAIVDAKGDLIAATANDTPARLAVGANNLYLVADSTQATGLKYEGAITSYTPTFTNASVGNGTVIAEYQRVGNLVFCYISFVLGSTSTITGDVHFTLPVGTSKRGQMNGTALYVDTGVSTAAGTFEFSGGNAYFRLALTGGAFSTIVSALSGTDPFTWGNTDRLQGYFYYEVA